jgi:hypothetical protein
MERVGNSRQVEKEAHATGKEEATEKKSAIQVAISSDMTSSTCDFFLV